MRRTTQPEAGSATSVQMRNVAREHSPRTRGDDLRRPDSALDALHVPVDHREILVSGMRSPLATLSLPDWSTIGPVNTS